MTLNIFNWIFGIFVFAAGIVNLFWGGDPGFGIFIILLSCVYLPPTNSLINSQLHKSVNVSIPRTVKIILGIFIIWALVGVGELFDKIELMLMSL